MSEALLTGKFNNIGSGSAVSIMYTATIGTTWIGTEAPYTQNITIDGILASDSFIADIDPSSDYVTAQAQETAWNSIYDIVLTDGKIIVYSHEVTTTEVPIKLMVISSGGTSTGGTGSTLSHSMGHITSTSASIVLPEEVDGIIAVTFYVPFTSDGSNWGDDAYAMVPATLDISEAQASGVSMWNISAQQKWTVVLDADYQAFANLNIKWNSSTRTLYIEMNDCAVFKISGTSVSSYNYYTQSGDSVAATIRFIAYDKFTTT